jgi:hypothetical protein
MFLGIISAVLFFAPIIYVLPHLQTYDNAKEAQISFISFLTQSGLFMLHSFAVLLAFSAFLIAFFGFLKKKIGQIAVVISLIVILAYILGYDKLFQIFRIIIQN